MKVQHAHDAKPRHMKFAAAGLIAATLLGGSILNANKAHANAVNDYVKQGLSQKKLDACQGRKSTRRYQIQEQLFKRQRSTNHGD